MESLREKTLSKKGWSARAIRRMCLASSTLPLYNGYLLQCFDFCDKNGVEFHNLDFARIVDFLCELADTSDRPKSKLNSALAAIHLAFDALELPSQIRNPFGSRFVDALVKSGTRAPMTKSTVLPIPRLMDIFLKWPDNDELSLKQLRMKAVCLLSITAML